MSREEEVRDVIIKLKSDKVNERKAGRQGCVELLEKDKTEEKQDAMKLKRDFNRASSGRMFQSNDRPV